MKLGDRIKLHIEIKPMFSDSEPDVTDGVFTVIGVSFGMAHVFGDHTYSKGFNSFEYGEDVDVEGEPYIKRRGSVYVPTPEVLNKDAMEDMVYDKKTVSWEILPKKASNNE